MAKLEVQQIPGVGGRVLCQMILGRDSMETFDELCDYGMLGVRRGVILQHDTQVILVSGLLAGSALPEFDGRPGRYRSRGRRRQIARDLVNLCGGEAVFLTLLATTGKNREKKRNSQQREIAYLDSTAIGIWLNRARLSAHGKLSSLFRRNLQQVKSSMKDGVFRRKRARSEPGFFLGLRCRRSLFIGGIRLFLRDGAHHFRWDDPFFHDRLSAGIIVVRDCEDQCRSIIQRDELLLRGETKRTLSTDVPALVRNKGGSQNFRGPRRRGVDQNGDGILPNNLFWLG